ncbi:MAG: enoyl-CoA hydratase/isomerase family protein [Alphaproteobacteria bacterium]|jgi:enoyl-CoA hydratase|nr:enoyl-CoA hydratase/isomerase family protein [Alphaproteobacteria bacterium]MDP6588225.1 enoyl-CoA hydratase/isomerase family protein [Alphaproteobacteria bacterium]MDP6819471.1 enoyl-CoA hydratase/isomerase family protein [Alphaproteobacteria bacterium]
MSEPAILSDVDGAIGVITINRPDKLNALDLATIEAMQVALSDMEADGAVRVIIFTGAGKAFVAGGDIADLNSRRGLAHYNEFAAPIHDLFRRIETCDKPTIGAVNGWALGGGCELMLALDIRIVSEAARIGVPEITLGLFPGAGGTQRLIRQIPLCRAKELMFAGDHISAGEAVALGLANRAVAPEELMPACRALAEKIAAKSPLALKLLKRTLANGADMSLPSALAHEQAMISLALDSEDAHEGCGAFLEKRAANFTGS